MPGGVTSPPWPTIPCAGGRPAARSTARRPSTSRRCSSGPGSRPAGSDGWFQPVRFRVRRIEEARSSLALVRGDKVERTGLRQGCHDQAPELPARDGRCPARLPRLRGAGAGAGSRRLRGRRPQGQGGRGPRRRRAEGHPRTRARRRPRRRRGRAAREWRGRRHHHRLAPRRHPVGPLRALPAPSADAVRRPTRAAHGAGPTVAVVLNPASAERLFAGSRQHYARIQALADSGAALPRVDSSAPASRHRRGG